MTVGLVLTALGLGLRHGIDWDHIAAIADLSSTAESRRRGFLLSFLYAIGHAAVVICLGAAAILFGASLPAGVDVWMGRVVGLTLVLLGGWVLIELTRKGRDFRLRSRWILVIGGTFAGLRRVRQAKAKRRLQIEHDHVHLHDELHADLHDDFDLRIDSQAHDHDHLDQHQEAELPVEPPVVEVGGRMSGRRSGPDHGLNPGNGHGLAHGLTHRHRHRHETALVSDGAVTGNGTAAGIGLLHGIGFESPTQIAVFVASTSLVGVWAGFTLLLAWVVGLIVANSLLAGLAAFGLLGAERNFAIYATVAAFVGVASLTMGSLMLLGLDSVFPAL